MIHLEISQGKRTAGPRFRPPLPILLFLVGLAMTVQTAAAQSRYQRNEKAEIWYRSQQVQQRIQATPSPPVRPPVASQEQQVAKRALAEAQARADRGDLDGAIALAKWADGLGYDWSREFHSPQFLLQLFMKRKAEQQAAAARPVTDPRANNPSSNSVQPNQASGTFDSRTVAAFEVNSERLRALSEKVDVLLSDRSSAGEAANNQAVALVDRQPPGQFRPIRVDGGLAPERGRPAIATTTPTVRDEPQPADAHHGLTSATSFAFGFIFCMLILGVAGWYFVKQARNGNGTLFRIELVSDSPVVAAAGVASNGGTPAPAPALESDRPAKRGAVVDGQNQAFPLIPVGPTFDEKRKQEAEAKRLKEEAILECVFEQNMELRRKLNHPASAAA